MGVLQVPSSFILLYPRQTLARRVREMAQVLSHSFAGCEPIVVGVLKGAFIFVADLVRELDIPVRIDFVQTASYSLATESSTESSGTVRLIKDLSLDIHGQDVILIDDILDTGLTLRFVIDRLRQRQPRSLTTCVLIDKRERRRIEVAVDHIGFVIPAGFVVGYGMDQGGTYSNLDGLYVVKSQ